MRKSRQTIYREQEVATTAYRVREICQSATTATTSFKTEITTAVERVEDVSKI